MLDYEMGSWSCAYQLSPVVTRPTLVELREHMRLVKGNETGWPVWLGLENRSEMAPRIVGDVLECWLRETPDGDFWRADPAGKLFLIRRLQEDTREINGLEPGTAFDLTLPIWRTGECLLHAARLADRLNAEQVELAMTWTGLTGRTLRAIASRDRFLPGTWTCHEDNVRTSITAPASSVTDTLPELVQRLTEPLYARFDFFVPPERMYSAELSRMRTGR